jgi:CBS domain-containing protein
MTNSQVLSRNEVTPAAGPRLDANAGTAGRAISLPITDAVTVRPEEPIHRAIRLLIRSRLSALPVVDANGALVGLLTEHDLLFRLTSRHRSGWAALWADQHMLIGEYRKATGTTVREVMGPPPIPLPADASVQTAADRLAQQGLREVPVVAAGRVVGVVSRSSLLALAELTPSPASPRPDADLVAEMKVRLHQEPWVSNHGLWVEATGGVLFFTGLVENEAEQAALDAMARTIPGCTGVENYTFPKTALRGRWF